MTARVALIACTSALALCALAAPAHADRIEVRGSDDERFHVAAFTANNEYANYVRRIANAPDRVVEYKREASCADDNDEVDDGIDQLCYLPPGIELEPRECEDGPALAPIWTRTLISHDPEEWSRWDFVFGWSCPEHLIPPLQLQEFQDLLVDSPAVHVQPSADVLVNRPAILYTDGDERHMTTTVFDTWDVDVIAVPVEFRWEFDDGTELVTAVPGAPYPSFEVAHTYEQPRTGTTVRLTVTWEGRYRVDADPLHKWRTVSGTAVTESVSDAFDVVELRTRLVDG